MRIWDSFMVGKSILIHLVIMLSHIMSNLASTISFIFQPHFPTLYT